MPSGNEATRQGSGIERGLEALTSSRGLVGGFEESGLAGKSAGPFSFVELH